MLKPKQPTFIFGRPVRGDEFLNRSYEIGEILRRAENSESTAIVGEPHIGKSSLLLRLTNPEVIENILGTNNSLVFKYINLHEIPASYTPNEFWADSLEPIRHHPGNSGINRAFHNVITSNYQNKDIRLLFEKMGSINRRLVLLLDEFERLLEHPNFQDHGFYGHLRGVSSTTGGLVIVLASRKNLAALNNRGHKLLATDRTGSPLFNTMMEIRLKPFTTEEIQNFFSFYQSASFSKDDELVIRRIAGNHPYLLQGMANALYQCKKADRYALAAEKFYESVQFHFADVWESLDQASQTTAALLCLFEFGGRVFGKDFNYGEIENVEKFGRHLNELYNLGLAEKVSEGWSFDRDHLLLWRGERWTVASQAFAWWIRDSIFIETLEISDTQTFLKNQSYRGFITQKQWDDIINQIKKAPDWAIRGVGALARTLVQELAMKG